MGILQTIVSTFTPPEPTPVVTVDTVRADVSNAEHEAERTANEASTAETVAAETASAATRAEDDYAADPSARNDEAVSHTAHAAKLAGIRARAARGKADAAVKVLADARAQLAALEATAKHQALLARADLEAFSARQRLRAAKIVQLVENVRKLARASDEDFRVTSAAGVEAGLAPLDIIHLAADIATANAPIMSRDEVISIRNERLRGSKAMHGPSLELTLLQPYDDLGTRKCTRDLSFSLEEVRTFRTFAEYDEVRAAKQRADAARHAAAMNAPKPKPAVPETTDLVAVEEEAPAAQRPNEFGREWW